MIDWLKSHIVDDLSLIWKRWSVKIVAAQVVLIATYGALAAVGLAPEISNGWKLLILGVLSAAALTVAALKQSNLPPV